MNEYVIVQRLVWGDYAPRYVGEAHDRQEHLDLLDRDAQDRGQGDGRMRIYSFVVVINGKGASLEVVAYGDREALTKTVTTLWDAIRAANV